MKTRTGIVVAMLMLSGLSWNHAAKADYTVTVSNGDWHTQISPNYHDAVDAGLNLAKAFMLSGEFFEFDEVWEDAQEGFLAISEREYNALPFGAKELFYESGTDFYYDIFGNSAPKAAYFAAQKDLINYIFLNYIEIEKK